MVTTQDCIPCFLRQIDEIARLVTADPDIQQEIIEESKLLLDRIDAQAPPPQMAQDIYRVIERKLGRQDPYREIKKRSNEMALSLYPRLKSKVDNSCDRLLTALEIAISGNIIDYGAKNSLDIQQEIDKLFSHEFTLADKAVFDYQDFCLDLSRSQRILYLADNAGEVVFDKILIEELNKTARVTYVVREKPIINDALLEDALACGIDSVAQIISSGSDAPGTILDQCHPDFVRLFHGASMVISKGQGNYETLSQLDQPLIYFLLKAKCPVVARHACVSVGNIVLKKNRI